MNEAECLNQKKQLRKLMTKRINTLSARACETAGRAIWGQIFDHIISLIRSKSDKERLCVGIYYPINGEPSFLELYSMEDKYNVVCVFPVIDGENLNFFRPRFETDFVKGPLGTSQPSRYAEPVEHFDLDVVLIPGLAFDLQKNRLGRGKGFYDRFIWRYNIKKPLFIGVCHSFQIMSDIVTQEHDASLDYIVSPQGII